MTNKKHLILASLLFVVGVGCITIVAFALWRYFQATAHEPAVPSSEIISSSTGNPSEKNPGPVKDEYRVPADQPRVIEIPRFNIVAYIQRVGVSKDNVMAAPNNIFFAGWYTGSVAPGDHGVSILNGHAGGGFEDGVFRTITQLEKGDSIRVQMGDSKWRDFVVESTKTHSLSETKEILFADSPAIERELHLITCDGIFDEKTGTYDKRFIVVARAL